MKRQLTKEDILKAKAIHLYDEDTMYVELPGTEDVYGSCKGGEWFVKENFWDYWESPIMLSYFKRLTPHEAICLYDKWQEDSKKRLYDDNQKFNEAMVFVAEMHRSKEFKNNIQKSLTPIPRKEAELLEDMYGKSFWDCIECDLENDIYHIYDTKELVIDAEIANQSLAFRTRSLEVYYPEYNDGIYFLSSYVLDEENTKRFIAQLRLKHGTMCELSHIFTKEFAFENGCRLFEEMCRKIDVKYNFMC